MILYVKTNWELRKEILNPKSPVPIDVQKSIFINELTRNGHKIEKSWYKQKETV